MPVALQMIKKSLLTLLLIATLAGFTFRTGNTASSNPLVSVDPKVSSGAASTTRTVNVTVANVTDLFSYDANLTYNPSILNCTGCVEGPFLGTAGATWWQEPVIDSYNGWIFFGNTLWGAPFASGNGTLAIITFDVLVEGRTPLDFSDTDLNTQDEFGVTQDILHDRENGVFTIPGDVDGDGYVGSFDAGVLNGAYGTYEGDPLYVRAADFDLDGYIGSADAGVLNGNYGMSA